jgi:hypothetical protein
MGMVICAIFMNVISLCVFCFSAECNAEVLSFIEREGTFKCSQVFSLTQGRTNVVSDRLQGEYRDECQSIKATIEHAPTKFTSNHFYVLPR